MLVIKSLIKLVAAYNELVDVDGDLDLDLDLDQTDQADEVDEAVNGGGFAQSRGREIILLE